MSEYLGIPKVLLFPRGPLGSLRGLLCPRLHVHISQWVQLSTWPLLSSFQGFTGATSALSFFTFTKGVLGEPQSLERSLLLLQPVPASLVLREEWFFLPVLKTDLKIAGFREPGYRIQSQGWGL